MARLHSIKAKGYNDEDLTRINDVAKALGTIDVALMDNEGNWRDMSDISRFVDIITAGTDALGGWNLIIPIAIAGIAGLIAIVYKAVTAIKTLQVALATGGGDRKSTRLNSSHTT